MENNRMENAHHGKWQKNHTLENDRKCFTENYTLENDNAKYIPWKIREKAHPGK